MTVEVPDGHARRAPEYSRCPPREKGNLPIRGYTRHQRDPMSRSPRYSLRHAEDPAGWDQRGRAASLLLLAVGVTAGVALVLGARRGPTAPRALSQERPRPHAPPKQQQRTVRDARRPLSAPSPSTDGFAREIELERRVLEAFRNDPILSERSIDIGAISAGDIELTGWVDGPQEVAYARTLARGVPGVRRVIEQLDVQDAPTVRVPRAD